MDAMVEDIKNQGDVQESMKRWWKLIHPADRPIARKYLLSVLQKSSATLDAISDGLEVFQEFETALNTVAIKPQRVHGTEQIASTM